MDHATTITPPTRDNLLGVCHALGESFGFDPIYLRLAFVALLLVDFQLTIVAYAAGAAAVSVARWFSAPRA